MPRQIPTIHRGDVFRLQRAKILRVVPVVKVPAETLQPVHRRERRVQLIHGLMRSQPAEIVGGDH